MTNGITEDDESRTVTLIVREAPFLADDELRLLGEVVVYGALLEAVTAGIHGALTADPNQDELSSASTRGRPMSAMLAEIRQLGDRNTSDWASDAQSAIERRHRLVHTAWIIRARLDQPMDEMILGVRTHREEIVSSISVPGDLEAARDACRDLWLRGRNFSATLHGLRPDK